VPEAEPSAGHCPLLPSLFCAALGQSLKIGIENAGFVDGGRLGILPYAGEMPDPKRAAVVFNPIKVDIVALREAVDSVSSAAGWAESLWFETTVEDVGQKVTNEALNKGADLVIVAGGDGTVRAIAEALHSSKTPLALVPYGTGNLFARNVKLILNDLPGSVDVAFGGTDKKVDLGIIDIERADLTRDRHAFRVMAGMGIDAK
jgi:diacylglycerol kinase (ATP)